MGCVNTKTHSYLGGGGFYSELETAHTHASARFESIYWVNILNGTRFVFVYTAKCNHAPACVRAYAINDI